MSNSSDLHGNGTVLGSNLTFWGDENVGIGSNSLGRDEQFGTSDKHVGTISGGVLRPARFASGCIIRSRESRTVCLLGRPLRLCHFIEHSSHLHYSEVSSLDGWMGIDLICRILVVILKV